MLLPGTRLTAESTEVMPIKCLAQGHNILVQLLLWLLLNYHRRLRLTLRSARAARRRRIGSSHSLPMRVVSHSYGGFGRGWMG